MSFSRQTEELRTETAYEIRAAMKIPGRCFLFVFLCFLPACLSVQLSPKSADVASNVSFNAPSEPYEKFAVQDVDRAWKNRSNGNSISFRTACNDPVESEINSIQQMIVDGLDAANIEKRETVQYNGREALHSVIQGKLDGIATKIELMIFKKNNCTYTLTYVALPKNYAQDQAVFQKFLKEFVAP
jgi:hypothetical protein